jgi:hypothetical protein
MGSIYLFATKIFAKLIGNKNKLEFKMGYYKCECGKDFTESQKFNGHKGHCKIHLASVGKLAAYADRQARASATGRAALSEQRKSQKQQKLSNWAAEQHMCERCGKVMTEKFGSGRFCSRACANTREHSQETLNKISASLTGIVPINKALVTQARTQHIKESYELSPAFCKICGKILPFEQRFHKTCSESCYLKALQEGGKTSASHRRKRSQNEIIFCNLCEERFGKDRVLHNEPIFNGWDADIILLDFKLAILWNGPWHYRKVLEGHSLEQVQNRDKIKIAEIEKAGYSAYIVNDGANKRMPMQQIYEEFNNLLNYLNLK